MYDRIIKRAEAVVEALPYLQKFHGKIFVIKYGGRALSTPEISKKMIEDIVLLKFAGMYPVLVHGGGPEITSVLEKRDLTTKFIQGMRVTTPAVMNVVEKVLSKINRKLVSNIRKGGVKSIGFYGKKGRLLHAKQCFIATSKGKILDLGHTGVIHKVSKSVIKKALKRNAIPVVSSIAVGPGGKHFNVNADHAASAIAGALKAAKLILLTDVRGVLDPDGKLISEVDTKKAKSLIKRKVISGGMIPKVRCGIEALNQGVEESAGKRWEVMPYEPRQEREELDRMFK
jgi:acetylglutamate kinase